MYDVWMLEHKCRDKAEKEEHGENRVMGACYGKEGVDWTLRDEDLADNLGPVTYCPFCGEKLEEDVRTAMELGLAAFDHFHRPPTEDESGS